MLMIWYVMHGNKNKNKNRMSTSSLEGGTITTMSSRMGTLGSISISEEPISKMTLVIPRWSTITLTNSTWEITLIL